MNANTFAEPFINKTNILLGTLISFLSYVFGDAWFLFAGYLGLNIADEITGYINASLAHKVNSHKGTIGILKKFGYWIMIMVSFGMSYLLSELGGFIGIDLAFFSFVGYFVLASLMINELFSIFENLEQAGLWVPKIIKKVLLVANKAIDAAAGTEEDD